MRARALSVRWAARSLVATDGARVARGEPRKQARAMEDVLDRCGAWHLQRRLDGTELLEADWAAKRSMWWLRSHSHSHTAGTPPAHRRHTPTHRRPLAAGRWRAHALGHSPVVLGIECEARDGRWREILDGLR